MSPVLRRASDAQLATALDHLNTQERHNRLTAKRRAIRCLVVYEMRWRERPSVRAESDAADTASRPRSG